MAVINPQDVINYAMQFVGVPYVWGGTSMSGVDCSGFMFLVAQHFGVSIPRGSRDQIKLGNQVGDISQAQPGDMIGFDSQSDGTAEHIGMYLGNGQIVVADNPSTGVHINTLQNEDRIVGIVRMSGVANLNGQPVNVPSGLGSMNDALGFHSTSAIQAARPTFDWWAGMGLKSPTLAGADETYGLIDSFIQSDPELGNLYSEAVAGNWTQDQFISQLQQTQWFQNNSATARQFLQLKTTDPAAYNRQVSDKQAAISEMAVKLGVHVSDNGLLNIAQTALMTNQSDSQVKATLSSYLTNSQQGWYGGYAGQVELGLKAYSADMGVPLSTDAIQNAVKSIVAGTDTLQAHRANIQTQAAGAFPAYADQINQGVTVGQIAKPYAFMQGKLWEQDQNGIDLQNPTLRKALQTTDDKGNPIVKQLYDFETDLRKDPRWLTTNNAREGAMSSAQTILSNMGLTASSVGNAPQTSPNQVQSISPAIAAQASGLSGSTNFPTLQGKEALTNPSAPTMPATGASLAPNTSFTSAGTPQGV